MNNIGQIELKTQNRIIKLFKEQLGYTYYGNWEEREKNSNIEESYLGNYLLKQGYSLTVFSKAIYELKQVFDNDFHWCIHHLCFLYFDRLAFLPSL